MFLVGIGGRIFAPRLVLLLLIWQRVGCKFLLRNTVSDIRICLRWHTAPPSGLSLGGCLVGSFLFVFGRGVRGEARHFGNRRGR